MWLKAFNRRPGKISSEVHSPDFSLQDMLSLGVLLFLLAWSFFGSGWRANYDLTHNVLEVSPWVTLLLLHLAGFMFFMLYKNIIHRTIIITAFGGKILLVGTVVGFYKPMDAFFAIRFETIALLLGLGIVSVILDQAGFFHRIAIRIARHAGGSWRRLLVFFCLLTFICSLLVNNLTTILVMVPITLSLAARLHFDPRPLIIGEIIAANIGGAATMIGDFPNMLISTETGIGFNQFIVFMMPPCLIFLAVLLFYLDSKTGFITINTTPEPPRQPPLTAVEAKATSRAMTVLAVMIVFFSAGKFIPLKPGAVAIIGALVLLFFSGLNRGKIIKHIHFEDIFFFIGLFVVIGAIKATGFLERITDTIMLFSGGHVWLSCLIMMWLAALMTAFLNAGPATTFFLPIVAGLHMGSSSIEWWALSLGVLAGSSATIIGATAGPVAATMVENFCSEHDLHLQGGNSLSSELFLDTGFGMMCAILVLSSVYMVFLSIIFPG